MKLCSRCRQKKPLEDFNKKRDGYQTYCRSCDNERNREWYYANKDRTLQRNSRNKAKYVATAQDHIWDLLKESSCIDCGENDPLVLEFDHVHGKKKHNIAELVTGLRATATLRALKEEIAKCEVVCANCHKRRTAQRGNWWKSIRLEAERLEMNETPDTCPCGGNCPGSCGCGC